MRKLTTTSMSQEFIEDQTQNWLTLRFHCLYRKEKKLHPPQPQNKYMDTTLLEGYLKISTLLEVEFGFIIAHICPASPSPCYSY